MQPSNNRILLVDDEEGIRFTIGSLLQREGYQVDDATCHVDAIACLQSVHYDLAFVDIMLAGDSGINLLGDIKAISPTTQVVMFTGFPQVGSAAAAVRLGAFDYITKPVRQETLLSVARHALTAKQHTDKLEQYRANMDAIFRTVTDSIIMVDKAGCLAHFNAMAEKACGYNSGLIGSGIAKIRSGCDGFCFTALQEVLSGKTPREIRRHECCSPEGKIRIVSLTVTPVIEADGAVSGAVAVIRDETLLVELERALHERGQFQGIVGASPSMQRVYSLIEALANVPTTVLICGESGTGKELVAKAMHFSGARVAGPLVKVNCSALSESLLESELFGHVRGAFTGAIADKVGRFQKADGGTLFLDEIGDISPSVQMRLLRVLQEHEFERVGESTSIKVDVRIIAATNQNLVEKVRQGIFREDLYYRLNVVQLTVPALRERKPDLDLLVAHFIAKFNNRLGREIQGVSDDVKNVLNCHAWPGNVRELEHAIESASIICTSDIISVRDLPQDLINSVLEVAESSSAESSMPSLPTPKKNISLEEALELSGGNKTRAAKLLGVSRLTLYRRIKKCE